MKRRSFLKRAAVVPAVVSAEAKRIMAGEHGDLTGAKAALQAGAHTVARPPTEVALLKFIDWESFRANAWRVEKRHVEQVYHLDPDLAVARAMSIATKFRIQKRRNRERWERDNKSAFQRMIARFGFAESNEFF